MSIIGEALLSASIEILYKRLTSTELLQFASHHQIQEDINKWKKILVKIKAVLEDAEEKQVREESAKIWLGELRNLAYDVEDILDEFATEVLRRKLLCKAQGNPSKVSKLIPSCFSSLSLQKVKFNSIIVFQMKEITERLQDLATQKEQMGLKEYSVRRSNKVRERLPTTSLVNEAKVYGREKDHEAIVELLLRDDLRNNGSVSIIPIVGMGGVGKTTLAQLAYNDIRLDGHFDLKAWVCVSEEFDVIRITKTLLLSIGVDSGGGNDLNVLQEELKKKLFKRKFLLILDDVWNENPNNWIALSRPIESGHLGSKIVVTTRNQGVSTMMGTVPAYPLKQLSYESCLSVFTQHSLGQIDFNMYQHLKEIGEKIVNRCNGLPLAAQALGGLLRGKADRNDWEDVLNSKIWDLPEERSDIMPALKVSYYYLPSHVKRCFAYCSIFPKDYEFLKEEIILLWMAEGLLQHKSNKKQKEDLGCEFFHDLKARAFFQHSSKDMSRFVMHDLINDLAQWAIGEICFRMDNKLDSGIQVEVPKNLRYLSYIRDQYDGVKKFQTVCDTKLLRTFLPIGLSNVHNSYLTREVLHMLPKLRYLRALSLCRYQIIELPNTIGELKHLRYLDLSHTKIETLPESTSNLYNLETLLLENCTRLKKICADIGNLVNLHHLNNSDALALEEMPLRIGNLNGLSTLPNFVVGKDSGSRLAELKSLRHISGRLCISGLENVSPQDAKKADLSSKMKLNVLILEWTSSSEDSREAGNETHVLDMLQPHQDLKELIISGYGGTQLPIWLGDSSFLNLVHLTIENCSKCSFLPLAGQLPFLKFLFIREMVGVKSVGPEFHACSKPFPSLETLFFEDMQEWEDWIPCGPDEEAEMFLHLRELSIIRCPKLVGRLPERLPSLERLVIRSCEQLLASLPSLPTLCRLEIEGCKQVVWRSTVHLSSPNSMVLSNISEHICPTGRFTQGLSKVEELKIVGCEQMTFLWQNRIELLQENTALRRLVIEHCPQLLHLMAEEEQEQHQKGCLPCRLQYLELKACESFVKLPQAFCNLSFLREISVKDCPKLVAFPDTCMPPLLRKVGIENCNALKCLPEAWMYGSDTYLESLFVKKCNSLEYIFRVQLPRNLKQLVVWGCDNLWTLIDNEGFSIMHKEITKGGNSRNTSLLEFLKIVSCPSLTSLWSKSELPPTLERIELYWCSNLACLSSTGNLPKALKYLKLYNCSKLESVAARLQNNTSIESVDICECNNLKFLPEDLNKLRHLQEITISNCASFVSFPEGGLPSMSLTTLGIYACKKLEALPNRMHNLTSLQSLSIIYCPSMISFPVNGLPRSLTSLELKDVNICKPLSNWGLHRLTSLTNLIINGGFPEVVSFPQEEIGMMLPTSLIHLTIQNFPRLEHISSEMQNFTSLERWHLYNCSKLKYLPDVGLPSSLLQLYIDGCPLLKQQCEKDQGRYWPMIANIPYVSMDSRFVYKPRGSSKQIYPPPKGQHRGPFKVHL